MSRAAGRALAELALASDATLAYFATATLLSALAVAGPGTVFTNSRGWALVAVWFRGSEEALAGACLGLCLTAILARLLRSEELRALVWGLYALFWTLMALSFAAGLPFGFGTAMYLAAALFAYVGFGAAMVRLGAEVD